MGTTGGGATPAARRRSPASRAPNRGGQRASTRAIGDPVRPFPRTRSGGWAIPGATQGRRAARGRDRARGVERKGVQGEGGMPREVGRVQGHLREGGERIQWPRSPNKVGLAGLRNGNSAMGENRGDALRGAHGPSGSAGAAVTRTRTILGASKGAHGPSGTAGTGMKLRAHMVGGRRARGPNGTTRSNAPIHTAPIARECTHGPNRPAGPEPSRWPL